MDSQTRNWFITGATGFIGRELVNSILRTTDDQVTLLVRDRRNGKSAEVRVKMLLDALGISRSDMLSRVDTFAGDVSLPGLGLSVRDRNKIQSRQTMIVHLAASTCFDSPLSVARDCNLGSTRYMLVFAKECHSRGNLDTFAYVSTAYVAADKTGLVDADVLDLGAGFRNSYERSKAEAEYAVRQEMALLPTVIFRPSIVVGHSQTGEATGSNTIYWGLKQYLRGQNTFFAKADASLDIVPVDYVVDAMLALLKRDDRFGSCFPLVAGPRKSISLSDFTSQVSTHFNRPEPRLLSPRWLQLLGSSTGQQVSSFLLRSAKHRRFMRSMLSYLPYFSSNPIFDDTATAIALTGTEIEVPSLKSYLPTLLDYCERQGWNRSAPSYRKWYQINSVPKFV